MTQPLQPAGVQAVVQNLDKFLADIGRMNTAMSSIGKGGFGALAGAATGATGIVAGLFGQIISVAGGILASDAIRAIARQIGEIGNEAEKAAENLQVLTIRLDNMIARQVMAADSTLGLEQALGKARGVTQDLLGWMEKMSLTTPFGIDQISDTASFAIAMGWGVDQAKTLTKAILDFSAGMGLGDETMKRIIYNFAQMKAAGKVTGTEMRDLARGAFFPLTEVLDNAAKKLGLSSTNLQQFRKDAAEGAIDIETFFQSFVEVVGKDFPDASTKLNFTMRALRDNVTDFVKIFLGWDMLGPVVARFGEIASKAFQQLLSPTNEERFKLLGKAILYTFNQAVEAANRVKAAFVNLLSALGIQLPTFQNFLVSVTVAVTTIGAWIQKLGSLFSGFVNTYIVPFVNGLQSVLGGNLSDVASNAFSWGANIIISLAEGIIQAAASAISAALSFVSRIFTSWLAPGSPPKILPLLNVWGAAAFTEYLRGFSMADFSALDSVQNAMKGSLDALVSLDMLTEKGGNALFKDLSKDLIEAIGNFNRTGDIGTEIFKRLREVGGGFGDELATLLQRQVDLAKGTERAAQAERNLKAAQQATKDATASTNTQIKEYNVLLRGGADKATLKSKLAQVNASERELDAARKREKAAEKANEEAQKALDPLKEAVSLQEKLIQQLIELAKAQKEATKGGGGGGGGAETPEIPEMPPLGGGGMGDVEKRLDDMFSRIKRQAEEKVGKVWDEIKAKWNVVIGPLIEEIKAKFGPLINTLKLWWDDLHGKLMNIWNNLKRFWDENGPSIENTIKRTFGKLLDVIGELTGKISRFVVEELLKFSGWVYENGPQISDLIDKLGRIVEKLADRINESWPQIESTIKLITDAVLGIGSIALSVADGDWGRAWEKMKTTASTISDDIVTVSLRYLENTFKLFGININISSQEAQDRLWNNSYEFGRRIRELWGDIWDKIKDKVAQIWEDIKRIFGQAWENLKTQFNIGIGELKNIWDNTWGSFPERLNAVVSNIKGKVGEFFQAGKNLVQGLIDGAASMVQGLIDTIVGAIRRAITGAKGEAQENSPSRVFAGIGAGMMQGLALGIQNAAGLPQMASILATAGTIVQAQQVAAPAVMGSNQTFNFNNTINNGMDASLFEQRVRQVIRGEL